MTEHTNRPFNHIALVGFGEAGTTLARGLCEAVGWRDTNAERHISAVDIDCGGESGRSARGAAMAETAQELGITISADYADAMVTADLVISVVTGDEAVVAARMAQPWLRAGTLYADFNSITGPQTRAVADELMPIGVDFIDVAVMGTYKSNGHRAPLLVSGQRSTDFCDFAKSIGTPARVLNEVIGDASAVKILRSVMMKGIEALSVECLVTARRQGLVDQVLDNMSDVDNVGFANFVKSLTVTHLVHAKRRMHEVEKAMENLSDTGVPALMSDATRRSHLRTVQAGLDVAVLGDVDFEEALRVLDEQVVATD